MPHFRAARNLAFVIGNSFHYRGHEIPSPVFVPNQMFPRDVCTVYSIKNRYIIVWDFRMASSYLDDNIWYSFVTSYMLVTCPKTPGRILLNSLNHQAFFL